jgi:hypothetical protein
MLRRGATILLPMLDFLVFVIGRQPAKIRRHQRRFLRLRCRLRRLCCVLAISSLAA